MRHAVWLLAMLLTLAACTDRKERREAKPLSFTDDVRLRCTPVKNQGSTPLCWAYAMLATIETEHIMQGDSVNLSVDWLARAFLREQATEAFMNDGQAITGRGVATMALRLIRTYGLTHYDAFHRSADASLGMLMRQLRLVRGQAPSLTDCTRRIDQQLDRTFGQTRPTVFFLGAKYTPVEFGHSVCRDDEYEALTSFTHHPFGQRFVLEVADNHYHDTFLNVPIDTLFKRVVRAVSKGHPVCWEGDISEPGFLFGQGIAILPRNASTSQQERQRQFENGQTTDDHCMTIVGLAHDNRGRRYFLMKNSWGTANRFGGYIYVSEDYLRLKTIAVVLPV